MAVEVVDIRSARSVKVLGVFSSPPSASIVADMDTEFEWDPKKAESNFQKHGVSFAEAATVFFDLLSITVPDPLHSIDEDRFVISGLSYRQRHLVVVHLDRGDRIRIITARLATPTERKKYESGIQ